MADRVGITIELIGKDAAISGLQEVGRLVNGTNGQKVRIGVDTTNIATAQSSLQRLASTVGSVSRGIGTTMQILGRGMTVSGMTMRRISNMFGGSILNKASYFVIGKGIQLINQGLNKSVSRFDTFRTFPKLMEAIGYSATDSQNAIEKLNQAVLGLPTSLNEIIETSKPFIQLYNDINKGTDLAIAANNAFLANASDAASKSIGLTQLEDLLTKGELTSTEWQSLMGSMGISLQYVAEQLGYGKDRMSEFREELAKGNISADDFLNALIAAGTGTGKLAQMADISKDTMSAALENISTAFSNLGASTLEAFDEILKDNTGEGLVDNIVKISDAIKTKVKPAVSGWMKDNADDIIGFFDKLASFNWGKLASSVVDNAGKMLDFFGNIIDKVGEDNIIKFVSFAMTWAGPLGKALTLFGRPLSYIGMLFRRFGGLLGRAGGGFGGGLGRGGGVSGSSILGSFAFLGEIAAVGGLIAEFAKVAEVVGNVHINKKQFEDNISVVAELLGEGGAFSLLLTAVGGFASNAGLGGAALAGEGLALGMEGLIAGVGGLITEFADVAQKVGNLDLTNFDANWDKLWKFMAVIAGVTGGTALGLGAVTGLTGGIGGIFVGIGELLEAGELENTRQAGNLITQFIDIANEISESDMPSEDELTSVFRTIGAISGAFSVRDLEIDASKVESINNALEAIKQISLHLGSFDLIANAETDITGASAKIEQIVSSLATISTMISEGFQGETGWQTGEQSEIISNMLSVIDNLKQSIPLFEEIQGLIDGIGVSGKTEETGTFTAAGVTTVNKEYIHDKFQNTIDQIKEIVQGMESISNEISADGSLIATLHDSIITGWEDNIVKNYNDVMMQLTSLTAKTKLLDTSDLGVGGAPQGAIDPFTKKTNDIKTMLRGIVDMMSEIGSQVPLIGTALKWFDSYANKNNLENLGKAMDSVRGIINKTNLSMKAMDLVDTAEIPEFKEKITGFMSDVKDVVNAFSTEMGLSENAADSGVDLGVMATNLESLATAMESVKAIVAAINTMESDLQNVTGDKRRGSAMYNLQEAMTGLSAALEGIPENADEIQERAENINSAITAVQSIMQSLASMQENIELVNENQTEQAAGSIIQSLIGALSGDDLEVTTESITALSELVGNIGTNLTTLGEVDLSSISGAVQELYGNLDTLKGSLDAVAGALQQVASNAQTADANLNTLASTASGRASSFSPMIGAVSNLAGQLSAAAGNANALTAAINSIPSYKSVTVAYNQVGSPGAASVAGGYLVATGGLIPQYRAGGGTIFAMRPVGSDTVPAMLTPGEFVLRKKAVDMLGVPFLRALNGLNIPSAIDSMMHGIRSPYSGGIITNDHSRTYNNNAKVNQTIYTNNPNYPLRIASRYARAL